MIKIKYEREYTINRCGGTAKEMVNGILLDEDQFQSIIDCLQYSYSAMLREWIKNKKLHVETRQNLINELRHKLKYIKDMSGYKYVQRFSNPILYVRKDELNYPEFDIYLHYKDKDKD